MVRYLTLSAFRSAETKGNKGIVPSNAGYKRLQERQTFFLVTLTAVFCFGLFVFKQYIIV